MKLVNTGDANTQQQILVEFASRIKDFDAFLSLTLPSIANNIFIHY